MTQPQIDAAWAALLELQALATHPAVAAALLGGLPGHERLGLGEVGVTDLSGE